MSFVTIALGIVFYFAVRIELALWRNRRAARQREEAEACNDEIAAWRARDALTDEEAKEELMRVWRSR